MLYTTHQAKFVKSRFMKAMSAFPTNSKLYSTINETNSCPGTYCLLFFPADVILYNTNNYYMSCTPLYVKNRQLIWNRHSWYCGTTCVLRDHIVSAPKGRVLAYILDSCVLWGVSNPDPKNEKHEKWHPIKSHNLKIDSLLKGKLKTKNSVNGWA